MNCNQTECRFAPSRPSILLLGLHWFIECAAHGRVNTMLNVITYVPIIGEACFVNSCSIATFARVAFGSIEPGVGVIVQVLQLWAEPDVQVTVDQPVPEKAGPIAYA